MPEGQELEGRLETVLAVIYLLFNEGHMRAGAAERLCEDAIHLGRLVVSMLPDGEALGLLALMLIQQSRRNARLDQCGALVLLADQNRALWDAGMIAEGEGLLNRIHATGEIGAYGLQASIAACHARATSMAATDWRRIVGLYDLLLEASPTPVVRLNRAVALAEVEGASAGLEQVETLLADPLMQRYASAHSVAADLLRRLGRMEEARERYEAARDLTAQAHEVAFIEARLSALKASS